MAGSETMEELLRQVASGSISPEEAAARIAALQRTTVAVAEEPIRRVRVTGLVHPTRIVGDAGITDASVT